MKKFLFLFFLILFLTPNVYASEFNMNSLTSASKDGTKNRYRGVEISETGMPLTFTFGTRYTGKLSTIETYFDYPFEGNTTYTLTYNMNTEDFRNNFAAQYWWDCDQEMNATNQHVGSVSYISYKKVKFTFKPSENTTCIRVLIGSSNQSSQAITGVSNWRLDSITLYDPAYQSGSSGGQGSTTPTPTPTTGATNQDIIDNQYNNTQDIINNNNQNTQDIIENNTENTDRVIDSIKETFNNCSKVDITLTASNNSDSSLIGKYLTYNGSIGDSAVYNISEYVEILPQATYTLTASNNSANSPAFCTYDSSYTLIRCTQFSGESVHYFHTGDDVKYFRTSLSIDSSYTLHLESSEVCINKFDALNDTMKDDNIDDKTSFFTDFEDNDHGLTSIITLPLSTIQNLTNSSCVALSVPIPFTNESVNLPCMSEVYHTYIPSIYNIWQVVSFGLISYFICLDIYKMVKGFKDPNEDKVEVLDL